MRFGESLQAALEVRREAPEAGLEPATRSVREPGEPTSDGAVDAKTGAESLPVDQRRVAPETVTAVRDAERRPAVSQDGVVHHRGPANITTNRIYSGTETVFVSSPFAIVTSATGRSPFSDGMTLTALNPELPRSACATAA